MQPYHNGGDIMAIDPAIMTAITTVGFPIIAFMLVYWDLRKKIESLTESVNELAKKIT